MWFDLEEDYWKAGTTLTCFSINRICGRLWIW